MRKIFPIFFFILSCIISASGQDLPRSASFGALVGNLNDSLSKELKLPGAEGTLIKGVIDNSAAKKAGFVVSDVITAVDGKKVNNTNQFLAILKEYSGGDKIKVSYFRKSKVQAVSVTLQPKPKETSNDYEIIYSSIWSGTNHLRTIITKPKGSGIFPAVLLVGGVGCYSIDNVSSKNLLSTRMWVDSLTRNGFVTFRVEKTGMGDSKGIPCNECDFLTEKQGYADGLKKLKSLPYVNGENIFIAGFSMGGVIGPLIASQDKVKGIVVYGTIGRNWFEYELENTHRQQLLDGAPADSTDLRMRAEYKRLYGLFVEKKTPQQITDEYPETEEVFFKYPMSTEYFQQVSDINIRQLWMNTDAFVLAMHGSSDFVSSAKEHELIADIVNRYHPGRATYLEIPAADHWEMLAENEKVSQSHFSEKLNPEPLVRAVRWLLMITKV